MKAPFQFKSIRSRLLFWFVLVSIVPLLIVSFIAYKQGAKAIKYEAYDKLVAIRDLKVQQVQGWMDERIGDIHTLADDYEIRSLKTVLKKAGSKQDAIKPKENARRILERYLKNYKDYHEVFIINSVTGKVEVSTDKSQEGKEKSNGPYFTEPMRTGKYYIKDIFFSKTRNMSFMCFSIPIFGATHADEIVGVLVARIDLRRSLYSLLLNRVGMGKTGETLIVNKDVVALNELRWYENAPLRLKIDARPALNASQGKTGITETKDYRGEKVLAAYTYIPLTKWGFVAKQDLQEIYSPIYELIQNILMLLTMSILFVSLIAWFISLSISRRIEQLSKTVTVISSGDISQKIEVEGSDEIAQLSLNFNQMTSKLLSIYKELEAFSYSVSHDLRAPLRSLDGFSKILLRDYNDKLDERGKDFLNRITNASQRMARIIDELLKLSRLTRSELTCEHVDLSELVFSIADELKNAEPGRRVEFLIKERVVANGDKLLLRQALVNLIGNAWKYTEKSPHAKIEFGVTQHNGERAYFVRDNGAGFDMAYANKLFSAFQRLHSEDEFKGIGIGLAIVKRIINRHGGRVWGEGKVNEGATFYFKL